jgi:hypothetical protein
MALDEDRNRILFDLRNRTDGTPRRDPIDSQALAAIGAQRRWASLTRSGL